MAIVNKLRISVPLLKYMQKDDQLRQLMVLTMIRENFKKGQSLLIPDGMLVQPVQQHEFDSAIDTYAGLSDSNANQVFSKLAELGIIEGAGRQMQSQVQPMDTRPDEATKRQRAETSTQAAAPTETPNPIQAMAQMLHALSQCFKPELIANLGSVTDPHRVPLPPPPSWAQGLVDRRSMVPWNDSQYIVDIGVQGKGLTRAVVDTGSCSTIIDAKLAKALGLPI